MATRKEINGVEVEQTSPHTTVVNVTNPEYDRARREQEKIRHLNSEFRKMIKDAPLIKFKPPRFYKEYLGSVYVYELNGYTVVVRFDGSEQSFPEPVFHHLMGKLSRILDSNISEENLKEL